ncbi:MazG family protein [Stappia sp. 22II-S9-Z10]|nr:MazG family protein [Stappia sp. 22II-S9-Z10]
MTAPIERLRAIMAQLRDPQDGCAWDIAQTYETIAPFTIEEAYEVADAIERGNLADLKDELGDLLLQVVFHAQMAAERGDFTFDDVCEAIAQKLIRRHPHIFSDGPARTPAEIEAMWDLIKAEERAGKPEGILDDVPVNFPPLVRAQKLQKRMAKLRFDWPDSGGVVDKIAEELEEFSAAVRDGDAAEMEAEFGDLLFTLVNYARHLDIDAGRALTGTNARFSARVRAMDAAVRAEGRTWADLSHEEMEVKWQAAKSKVENAS